MLILNVACATYHYERPEDSPHDERSVRYCPTHGDLPRGCGYVLPDTVYSGDVRENSGIII
jgi:hypothetical protein